MKQPYLEIGTIVGVHGLRGELRVLPACDSPAFFAGFSLFYWDAAGQSPVRVLGARAHKNVALLRLEGVETIEAAEALRGRRLWFRREDAQLPRGQYFIAELLDCRVLDAADPAICYGTLCDVSKTGANDVWHIRQAAGSEVLIPVIDEVVRRVELDKGEILITPIRGLF
ncbi:MAG: ribosome maturation factor RimM [Oscillospiraceae bacterium]|jgi:16S rRNA processing protein RimM|nr:ribosome maturation factor RimM [Oscillospiraceae bacterium]